MAAMKARVTGSRVHRVWKCPASAVLAVVDEGDKHEPARARGKQIHAYLERVKVIGEAEALAEAPRDLWPLLKGLNLDELPAHLATEVAYAWNWRTGTARELGRNLERDYSGVDWDCEIPGTYDIVGCAMASHVGLLADYKTGHVKHPPPDMFGQTLLGGASVRSRLVVDDVILQLIYIMGDGDHYKVTRTVSAWELDTFELELQAAMLELERMEQEYAAGRMPNVHEGPWCDYCPAYRNCPAKVAFIREIPDQLARLGISAPAEPGAALELDRRQITVARAAQAWMMVERIEEALAQIKQEICGFGAFQDIPLPDGRVIGVLRTERRALDGRIAAQVLLARYGQEAVDEAIELRCSLDAFTTAIATRKKEGEVAQSKKGTGIVDLALAEVGRLGGIGVNSTESVKPHVPKRKLRLVR